MSDPNRPEDVYPLIQADVPGVGIQIPGSLKSPHADEFAVGVSRAIGTRGAVRIDFVDRKFADFYGERVDLTTGTATLPLGEVDVIAGRKHQRG